MTNLKGSFSTDLFWQDTAVKAIRMHSANAILERSRAQADFESQAQVTRTQPRPRL